jgi:SAM-dependent methyltransferase
MESIVEAWHSRLRSLPSPRVLEIGTKAWDGKPSRNNREPVLQANCEAHWDGLDTEAGDGVTIVGDLHNLPDMAAYDLVLCLSVLEHVRRPWEAALELRKTLKPGGLLLLQSHHTFPYHPYPRDYFRFSREAICELFRLQDGWAVNRCEYSYPCRVVPLGNYFPHALNWNFEGQAWLNVEALIERV